MDLDKIVCCIFGFIGVDLFNLLNEVVILVVCCNLIEIFMDEVNDVIDWVLVGFEKKNWVMSEKCKILVVYYEVGYVLVGVLMFDYDLV